MVVFFLNELNGNYFYAPGKTKTLKRKNKEIKKECVEGSDFRREHCHMTEGTGNSVVNRVRFHDNVGIRLFPSLFNSRLFLLTVLTLFSMTTNTGKYQD